jgi:hypothetical protein
MNYLSLKALALLTGIAAFASASEASDLDTPKHAAHKATTGHQVKRSGPGLRGCAAERSFDTLIWAEPSDNGFDPQIGCALRGNLNAMVANKRDLVHGRGTPYSDGERAAQVVKQYREGRQPTDNKIGVEGVK